MVHIKFVNLFQLQVECLLMVQSWYAGAYPDCCVSQLFLQSVAQQHQVLVATVEQIYIFYLSWNLVSKVDKAVHI